MSQFPHFELSEFISSAEAKRRGIDNSPSFEIVTHLAELCEDILEPLRVAWGKPITVTSGYRCPRLNHAVGGVATSAHKTGYAADLQSGDAEKFFDFICKWVKAYGVRFDQIFIEQKKGTKWIHIGLKNNAGQQRGMISRLNISE